ncbi:hypothetical protein EDB85DRAFT_2232935 [Lactarius pseudohatsudake]|nr:hypothetical protein EDB85DRAFT_2232935 [Lactarius pseudohatsudake]
MNCRDRDRWSGYFRSVITKWSLRFIAALPLPLRWVIVVARALLIIVTESTVAELPVVDNGLVSGVKAGVIGVEDEVRNEVVVVDEELVKLVELVGIVLDVDEVEVCRVSESLTEELEIKEDDELEAIKLESEETCGEGVGEEEELGDGVEEVLQKGRYTAESGPSRSGSLAADASSSSHIPQHAFEELNQDVEMIEVEEGDDVDDMFPV